MFDMSDDCCAPSYAAMLRDWTVRRDTICKQVIVQLTTGVAPPWDGAWDGENYEQITSRLTDWHFCAEDASMTSYNIYNTSRKTITKT